MATTVTVNTTRITDADGDTGAKSEPSADLDRLDLFAGTSGGGENGIEITGDDSSVASLNNPYVKVLKHIVLDTDVRIQDAVSGDTYIEMTDQGDANVIKLVASGVALANFDGPNSRTQFTQNAVFTVGKSIADLDGDTKIQLEETSDDDTIRFDAGGTEILTLTATAFSLNTDIGMVDSGATVAGKRIGDEDLDTYIQFNQATGGTDDDTIRMYAGGVEVMNVSSTGLTLVVAASDFGVGGNLGTVSTFDTQLEKGIQLAAGTAPTNLGANEVSIHTETESGNNNLVVITNDSGNTVKLSPTTGSFPVSTWPSFSASLSTDQVVSSGTEIEIVFGTEDFDKGPCFGTDGAGSNSAANTFAPGAAGVYILTTYIVTTGIADSAVSIVLYKNGVAFRDCQLPHNAGGVLGNSTSFIVEANGTTDFFALRLQGSAGDSSYTILRFTAGTTKGSFWSGSRIA